MTLITDQEFFARHILPGMDPESDYDPSEWEDCE